MQHSKIDFCILSKNIKHEVCGNAKDNADQGRQQKAYRRPFQTARFLAYCHAGGCARKVKKREDHHAYGSFQSPAVSRENLRQRSSVAYFYETALGKIRHKYYRYYNFVCRKSQ